MMLNSRQNLDLTGAAGCSLARGHANSATLPVGETVVLDALRSGQPWAIAAVVRMFGGRLLSTARRLSPTEDDAREAVHTAFLSVLNAQNSFESFSELRTSWHRAVINIAVAKATASSGAEEPIEPLLPQFTEDGLTPSRTPLTQGQV